MASNRFAFVEAGWHQEVVDRALQGFLSKIPEEEVDVFDVPGAFELPLAAQELAKRGRYQAIAAAALVVDGGNYRHDFVAQAVVNGLMQVGLETGIPILSVSLTPHYFRDEEPLATTFMDHFFTKGQEAASAALALRDRRENLKTATADGVT